MTNYQTIVVGTDGSETSLRAVDRAAAIAAESGATLIVASAHPAPRPGNGAGEPDLPRGENYRTEGNAPVYALLRDAAARARAAGAGDVQERAVDGAPADALVALAAEVGADLLVVGNVGMNSVVGRLVGSVPRIVARHAKTEVLVVDTAQ